MRSSKDVVVWETNKFDQPWDEEAHKVSIVLKNLFKILEPVAEFNEFKLKSTKNQFQFSVSLDLGKNEF